MTQKIHKLCLIRGYKEAYYQLSDEERENLWKQLFTKYEELGAKLATPYYNCRWSTDQYQTFFIVEYPDVESAIQETANVEEIGLFRYMVSETILGIEREKEAVS